MSDDDIEYVVNDPMSPTFQVPATRIKPVHSHRPGLDTARRLRLGEALVGGGVITEAQLEQALATQLSEGPQHRKLGEIVVALGLATEVHIARGLATILGFEFVEPNDLDINPHTVRRIPREFSVAGCVLPIAQGTSWLQVALANPTDGSVVDRVRKLAGVPSVSIAVSTPSAIQTAIQKLWAIDPATVPAPEVSAYDPVAEAVSPAATTDQGYRGQPCWEYRLVGDDLPREHAGYCADLADLDNLLARLGRVGWEAVGTHGNGSRMRVLLKRHLWPAT